MTETLEYLTNEQVSEMNLTPITIGKKLSFLAEITRSNGYDIILKTYSVKSYDSQGYNLHKLSDKKCTSLEKMRNSGNFSELL